MAPYSETELNFTAIKEIEMTKQESGGSMKTGEIESAPQHTGYLKKLKISMQTVVAII